MPRSASTSPPTRRAQRLKELLATLSADDATTEITGLTSDHPLYADVRDVIASRIERLTGPVIYDSGAGRLLPGAGHRSLPPEDSAPNGECRMANPAMPRLAVLTSGGDAQGMNAAVRAVVRTALNRGAEIYARLRGLPGAGRRRRADPAGRLGRRSAAS